MGRGRASAHDRAPAAEDRPQRPLERGCRLRRPPLPLPTRVRRAPAGPLRARARRSHARRADRASLSRRQASLRTSDGSLPARRLPRAGGRHARVAGPRDDLRPSPVRGAARGDGAVSTLPLMEGQASISTEILGRYAADAAREIVGVRDVPGRRSVQIENGEDGMRVELHLALEWGGSIPETGRSVQERVREYLLRMADVEPLAVEVVVDEIGPRA